MRPHALIQKGLLEGVQLNSNNVIFIVILVEEGREDLITTKRGPTSACIVIDRKHFIK